ncbi:uncharacterized protein K441DRAFT_681704 [Cenococcum geophilum 1.58]|uniref:uncharacterized protein n=1 Tax=Cenococcum geophilum 1.58 TaxID=794803 RepID=UPI00358FF883|nr:hypothetical protein K441DRAFT_681704 [Cenococcum geophilum 1.58]
MLVIIDSFAIGRVSPVGLLGRLVSGGSQLLRLLSPYRSTMFYYTSIGIFAPVFLWASRWIVRFYGLVRHYCKAYNSEWVTNVLRTSSRGRIFNSCNPALTIIGIGGTAGVSSAPVIAVAAEAVEDLAILSVEGSPPATASDPRSGTAAKGPSSTGGDSRERMLWRGVIVARGLVVRGGGGGGMVLSLKGSAKRGSTSLIYSLAGSWKATLWMAAWWLLNKKKRGIVAMAQQQEVMWWSRYREGLWC